MKLFQIISASLIVITTTISSAQEVECNQFCVTGIQMDSVTPGQMNVTIYFEGVPDQFIGYPHVTAVIDLSGDTLGTGRLNFFGQIYNTSQDYPVQTDLTSIPSNLQATILFAFDDDTCALSYPCTTTGVQHVLKLEGITVSPNPMDDHCVIITEGAFEDLTVRLYNSNGLLVRNMEHQTGTLIKLYRDNLPGGFYFLELVVDEQRIVEKLFLK